ncbi:hypothetical protein J1N35_002951 [Gossypium stocksii]|uniref:Uncharacterized protein n=1 Tax=Gossypium stocksii TaxID=47602 RepID=A0A9D3WN27_9ROSI|nr:hypothetical protein J1N35_002951 [Gossypium stocksii]
MATLNTLLASNSSTSVPPTTPVLLVVTKLHPPSGTSSINPREQLAQYFQQAYFSAQPLLPSPWNKPLSNCDPQVRIITRGCVSKAKETSWSYSNEPLFLINVNLQSLYLLQISQALLLWHGQVRGILAYYNNHMSIIGAFDALK